MTDRIVGLIVVSVFTISSVWVLTLFVYAGLQLVEVIK